MQAASPALLKKMFSNRHAWLGLSSDPLAMWMSGDATVPGLSHDAPPPFATPLSVACRG